MCGINMTIRNLLSKRSLILPLITVLLMSCDKSEQDYRYVIVNKTTAEEPIEIQYNVEGVSETLKRVLQPGDSVVLAERSEIRGKKIWDIETSVDIYKVKHLQAYSQDQSMISEELAFRKLWKGPENTDNVGIYQLDLSDEHFVLSKQEGYTYCIKNEMRDTIFSTSHLKTISGENTTRSSDTILRGTTQSIGSVDIYTYSEDFKGEKKYKTQKMTGLSSIFFLYKNNRYTISKTKDTAYFEISKDTCTLVISENMSYFNK